MIHKLMRPGLHCGMLAVVFCLALESTPFNLTADESLRAVRITHSKVEFEVQGQGSHRLRVPFEGPTEALVTGADADLNPVALSWQEAEDGLGYWDVTAAAGQALIRHITIESPAPADALPERSDSRQRPDGTLFLGNPDESGDSSWSWSYTPTRPGRYNATLFTNQHPGPEDSFALTYGETSVKASGFKFNPENPGMHSIPLGAIALKNASEDAITVTLSRQNTGNEAAAEVVRLVLTPTTEGGRPAQSSDGGEILLHSRNATINGIKLQYEPQPHKITVGYWIHASDWFYWDFEVARPGKYQVEIHQGCGKGQGGSQAAVVCEGQSFPFIVEDTGHFQNFIPRDLGVLEIDRPGIHRLWVKALSKARGAVMDVRQLKLKPVE